MRTQEKADKSRWERLRTGSHGNKEKWSGFAGHWSTWGVSVNASVIRVGSSISSVVQKVERGLKCNLIGPLQIASPNNLSFLLTWRRIRKSLTNTVSSATAISPTDDPFHNLLVTFPPGLNHSQRRGSTFNQGVFLIFGCSRDAIVSPCKLSLSMCLCVFEAFPWSLSLTPSHNPLRHDYRQRGRKKLVGVIDLCPFEQLQLNSGRDVIVVGCGGSIGGHKRWMKDTMQVVRDLRRAQIAKGRIHECQQIVRSISKEK